MPNEIFATFIMMNNFLAIDFSSWDENFTIEFNSISEQEKPGKKNI